jgi:transposase
VTRQRFTRQFKDDAVRMVLENGYSCEETGRRLGVTGNNINRWVRQYRDRHEVAADSGLTREQLEFELKRLRKENKRLEMEREILKKATAFFAKESSGGSTSSGSK